MQPKYRYVLATLLLLAAVLIKHQDIPVHPNTSDILPQFSALSCQIEPVSALSYKSGSNELTLSGALRSVRNGDYHVIFSSKYAQVNKTQDSSIEQPIVAANYQLQVKVINSLQQARLIGDFPVPTTGQTDFDYIGQDGDNDLQLTLIPRNASADNSTFIYVHALRVIPETALSYQQAVRSFTDQKIPLASGAASTEVLSGERLAIPLRVNQSTTLAQVGLPILQSGNGGTGTYNVTLTDATGTTLAFDRFLPSDLATLTQPLTNSPTPGFFYLPLPYQLQANHRYVIIVSGQNVAGNRSNSLRLMTTGVTKAANLPAAVAENLQWGSSAMDLVTTNQKGLLPAVRTMGTGQGYISYQSQGNYLDYFDTAAEGKRYDSFNNAVTVAGTDSLIYQIGSPGVLINTIGVAISQDCQNDSPIALSYSTDDRSWKPLPIITDVTVHATQAIDPSASVWIKVSSAIPRAQDVLAIENISINGSWQNAN